MLIQHIALVSEFAAIDASGLARVCAAIQKQITRDLAPAWGISATIDAFPRLEEIPPGYWPIIVTAAGLPAGLAGVHSDDAHQPLAYVEWSEGWSITASHECIEMLVDPSGNRLVSGRSPVSDDDRAEYLVEVCDPCQSAEFAYPINDTLVSDFCTPEYYDAVPRSGARYCFSGAIQRPREVLPGGYLSWREPRSADWWQVDGQGTRRCIGPLPPGGGSLRARVDRTTRDHLLPTKMSNEQLCLRLGTRREHADMAAKGRADRIRALRHRFEQQSSTLTTSKGRDA
jgi:hypothetical protein